MQQRACGWHPAARTGPCVHTLSTPSHGAKRHLAGPAHHSRMVAARALDFLDEDPNAEEPSTSELSPATPTRRLPIRRRAPPVHRSLIKRVSQAEEEKVGEAEVAPPSPPVRPKRANKQKAKERKPTEEELRAMGYDDVDDFSDDDGDYESVVLEEDDPMYVPTLDDAALAEDPPDHRSGYVAVIGKPNAGKSTLINALVGQKLSIVSFKPQTTRHRIMGIASGPAFQMIVFDTPGIIERKRNKLEERMMAAVVGSIQDSEAIIAVVDCADEPKEALAMFQPGQDWNGPSMSVLLNKSDLLSPTELEELVAWYKENCRAEQVFLGSALHGTNVQAVKDWAVTKLPLGPTLYSKEIVSEQPQRFFVSELIREKIFFLYDHEIPYSSQVQILEWKERPKSMKLYILAQIVVERESQKEIMIGARGMALKELGRQARKVSGEKAGFS